MDISQNNFQSGDLHWDRVQYIRNHLLDHPKPITNIKVYGTDHFEDSWHVEYFGTAQDATERYWRNILGGTSATRFHRPPWGIGINETARAHVKSARMLSRAFDIVRAEPANDLILNRQADSAYLMAVAGEQYAVYLPKDRSVRLQVDASEQMSLRWLEIERSAWHSGEITFAHKSLLLETPASGQWIAVIELNR